MRRGLAYAALGVVLLLAPACQGDPEPQFAPSESPSPSSTPPEPTPSDEPEALSPEQTVRAWVEGQNALLLRNDRRQFLELSSKNCTSCTNLFLAPITETYERGGSYSTAGWRVLSLDAVRTSGRWVVTGTVRIPGGETVNEAGANPVGYETSERTIRLELASTKDHLEIAMVTFP